MRRFSCYSVFFFFNDTATTEIYTLSLHDALPILNLPILNKRLFAPVRKLLVDAQRGICFSQEAQLKLKDKIIELTRMQGFQTVLAFLSLLYELSISDRYTLISNRYDTKEIGRASCRERV